MNDINNQIYLAIRKNEPLANIMELVANGANVLFNSEILINNAVELRNLELIKFLIDNGVNHTRNDNFVLRYAAFNGYQEIIDYLISISENKNESIMIASNKAIEANKIEVIDSLLKKHNDLNKEDLMLKAIQYKKLDIVNYLVQEGADLHHREELFLYIACREGNINMVNFLVENGADIDANDNYALKETINFSIDNFEKNKYKKPQQEYYLNEDKFFKIAQYLIEKEANVYNVVYETLTKAVKAKFPEMMEYILDHGGNIKIVYEHGDPDLIKRAEVWQLNKKLEKNMPNKSPAIKKIKI